MPIPFIVGAIAVAAGAVGAKKGISGALKIKEAKERAERCERRHNRNVREIQEVEQATKESLDELGVCELETLKSFEKFSDVIERIQERPKFKEIALNDKVIEAVSIDDIRTVSVGADVMLGAVAGAGTGAASGVAAAGATTAVVASVATASTGTAIAGLSGAAATNATLAAIGGGSLAAGGGGVALGSALLSGATLGVGLLVGGFVIGKTADSLEDKSIEMRREVDCAEEAMNEAKKILTEILDASKHYVGELGRLNHIYQHDLKKMEAFVGESCNWYDLSEAEQGIVKNCVYLVTVLYNMCKVKFVNEAEDENSVRTLNKKDVNKQLSIAGKI